MHLTRFTHSPHLPHSPHPTPPQVVASGCGRWEDTLFLQRDRKLEGLKRRQRKAIERFCQARGIAVAEASDLLSACELDADQANGLAQVGQLSTSERRAEAELRKAVAQASETGKGGRRSVDHASLINALQAADFVEPSPTAARQSYGKKASESPPADCRSYGKKASDKTNDRTSKAESGTAELVGRVTGVVRSLIPARLTKKWSSAKLYPAPDDRTFLGGSPIGSKPPAAIRADGGAKAAEGSAVLEVEEFSGFEQEHSQERDRVAAQILSQM